MKKLISYTLTALFVTIAISMAGPDKDAIEAKEKAAWQSFKDKRADDFKKVVDKDIRCVYADGASNLEKELADMKKWEKDVIVTTYTVKVEGTVDGKDASGTYNSGSVWKKEGNDWLAIFHTNIKQEAASR
jgi:hypothetical protein